MPPASVPAIPPELAAALARDPAAALAPSRRPRRLPLHAPLPSGSIRSLRRPSRETPNPPIPRRQVPAHDPPMGPEARLLLTAPPANESGPRRSRRGPRILPDGAPRLSSERSLFNRYPINFSTFCGWPLAVDSTLVAACTRI